MPDEAESHLEKTKLTTVMPQKLIGDLEQYIPGEDFEDYLERSENNFEMNYIKVN